MEEMWVDAFPIGTDAACLWRVSRDLGERQESSTWCGTATASRLGGFTVPRAGFRGPERWFGR